MLACLSRSVYINVRDCYGTRLSCLTDWCGSFFVGSYSGPWCTLWLPLHYEVSPLPLYNIKKKKEVSLCGEICICIRSYVTCSNGSSSSYIILYIHIAHLESDCSIGLSSVNSQLFCLGHFAYCVIPYWGGATLSQINSLGSIQACHLTWGSTSILSFGLFNVAFTHTLTHGR